MANLAIPTTSFETLQGIVMTEPAIYVLKSGTVEFKRYRPPEPRMAESDMGECHECQMSNCHTSSWAIFLTEKKKSIFRDDLTWLNKLAAESTAPAPFPSTHQRQGRSSFRRYRDWPFECLWPLEWCKGSIFIIFPCFSLERYADPWSCRRVSHNPAYVLSHLPLVESSWKSSAHIGSDWGSEFRSSKSTKCSSKPSIQHCISRTLETLERKKVHGQCNYL